MSRQLSTKIAEHIHANARLYSAPPVWNATECEMAAEIQRLAAENMGLRAALEAIKDGSGLAKDLQAVRDACAAKIDSLIDEAEPRESLKRLGQLADDMRGRG